MDKLKMRTPDRADENFHKLSELFPNAVTETIVGYDEAGKAIVERAIDKDVLAQEISAQVVDGRQERYQFTWPDKRKSVVLANAPIAKTLRLDRAKSVGRDGTPGGMDSENVYIEGDNLDALKLLQETYLGKVKMIYIDPPYNTGSDFIYEDDFSQPPAEYLGDSGQFDGDGNRLVQNTESNGRFHTDWLNMMYPRLKIARDFLSDDGFIAISMGEEECDNLRKICDEVFGRLNFRNMLALRRYDKNLNLQFVAEGLPTMNVGLEYIYIYSRNPISKMTAVYKASSDMRAMSGYWKGFWNNADRPTMRYPLFGYTPSDGQWKWKREVAEEAVSNYKEYIEKHSSDMTLEEYWEKTGKTKRFIRRNANGTGKNMGVEHWVAPALGILRNSNWSDMLVSKPTGVQVPFDSPKNPDVLVELMNLFSVHDEDIILDFFSGSATTAHAVMQLNAEDGGHRKFIMVQLPEQCDAKSEAYKAGYKTICEIGEERIRRAGKKIRQETGADIDCGFRVFKVDSSNMRDVYYRPAEYRQDQLEMFAENIKPDRTPEDLLFQVMLDLGVPLSSGVEELTLSGKRVFSVADGYLLACFDEAVSQEAVTEIAKRHPFYAVFRDSGLGSDSLAANFEQIFKTYSPNTERKVL